MTSANLYWNTFNWSTHFTLTLCFQTSILIEGASQKWALDMVVHGMIYFNQVCLGPMQWDTLSIQPLFTITNKKIASAPDETGRVSKTVLSDTSQSYIGNFLCHACWIVDRANISKVTELPTGCIWKQENNFLMVWEFMFSKKKLRYKILKEWIVNTKTKILAS